MASILDAGLANTFSIVFVFLLIYAVVYGVLSWRKWMGDQKGLYAIIAFAIAFLMALSPPARGFIQFVAPWYLALALVVFFVLFIVSMFGLSSEKDFPGIIKDSRVRNWIMIFIVVILLAGLAFTFGQSLLNQQGGGGPAPPSPPPGDVIGGDSVPVGAGQPTSGGTYQTNLINAIVHPKVLGMILLLLIASVAVFFLSKN